MSTEREKQGFPTRIAARRGGCPVMMGAAAAPPEAIAPNTLYRHVAGLDAQARRMTAEELVELGDPMGMLLRSGRPFPLSMRSLIRELDGLSGDQALPDQLVFLAADGGHIPWTPETNSLRREFRFAVARGRGVFDLLISCSTALDSTADQAFLQIIGWDSTREVFHYYQRLSGTFFWAGMSLHALEAPTRGEGPFDSHVNGSLVMKELRAPWIFWHAPQAGINAEAFAPDDDLRNELLFTTRQTAERLESEIVRPGISRWNSVRVRKAVDADGTWRKVPQFFRQVLTDTTVNLATADVVGSTIADDTELAPPLSFFINRDTLFNSLDLVPDDLGANAILISGKHYREFLQRHDVHRSDDNLRVEGDVHFAFLTPEPAFEDTDLTQALLDAGLVGERFVACLQMVDFTNPVFSSRRSDLMRHVPEEVEASDGNLAAKLEELFVNSVKRAIATDGDPAASAGSTEREFLANWETADFRTGFTERIGAYFQALQAGMADAGVVDGWLRMAESRRRLFRGLDLAEFKLTTPRTNIPQDAPLLWMSADGRAEPRA